MRMVKLAVLLMTVLSVVGCSSKDKQEIAQAKYAAKKLLNGGKHSIGGIEKITKNDAIKIVEALKNSKLDEAQTILEPKRKQYFIKSCEEKFASELASLKESKISECVSGTAEDTRIRLKEAVKAEKLDGAFIIPTGTYTYLESDEVTGGLEINVRHFFKVNYSDKSTAPIDKNTKKTVSELIMCLRLGYPYNDMDTYVRDDTFKFF